MGDENALRQNSSQESMVLGQNSSQESMVLGQNSSQESLPMSQETFQYLWNEELSSQVLNGFDIYTLQNLNNSNLESTVPPENDPVQRDTKHLNQSNGESVDNTSTVLEMKEGLSPSSVLQSNPNNLNYIPASLPASQNWPGNYEFNVSFGPQDKTTKGVSWTYSKIKHKLYVGKDVPCPINCSGNCPLSDVYIRALPLFSSPEHAAEVVHRCVNHSMEESQRGVFEAEHLVRCESSMATYEIDQTTKRQSVLVPFENPPAGQEFSTYLFKFTCFGSCSGGPNRKPLMLIFSLEKQGEVIGRHKLDVKICACPGRDRKCEEKLLEEESPASFKRKDSEFACLTDVLDFAKSVSFPCPKKSKVQPNGNGVYTLTARDKECYDFLKQMKKLYEICKTMKDLPPDVKKSLMQHSLPNNG